MGGFQCEKCGACCKMAGHFIKNLDRGDGMCIYLRDDNLCEIYDFRPNVCRVDKMWKMYFKHVISRDTYYALAKTACEFLREKVKEGEKDE